MNPFQRLSRLGNQSDRDTPRSYVLYLAGLFWIFTYLALSIWAELQQAHPALISERRFFLTWVGAMIFASLIGYFDATARRNGSYSKFLLILCLVPAGLLLFGARLLYDAAAPHSPSMVEGARWSFVWTGSFAVWLFGWAALRPRATRGLSASYAGNNAALYEHRRFGKKWVLENLAVEQLLREVAVGSKALDIPVGTGRFFPQFKARGIDVVGVDASPDMIREAQANARRTRAQVRLERGDILSIPYDDGFFDLVVCIRFLNLIDGDRVKLVLHELTRVSGDKLLIGVRYLAPFSELGPHWGSLTRLAMRLLQVPRYLSIRRNLVFHDKPSLWILFDNLGLQVLNSQYVERRWDGTDYDILLLEKRMPTW